jgi:hypothetical protein
MLIGIAHRRGIVLVRRARQFVGVRPAWATGLGRTILGRLVLAVVTAALVLLVRELVLGAIV